jgi:Skp family chaperone for outer membrane proteins
MFLVSGRLGADEKQAAEGLQVGTYTPQKIFQQSGGGAKLMEARRDAQKQAQEAQKNGDQKKLQKLQQDYRKKQMAIIQDFQKQVKAVLPEVAEKTGVEVIAAQVQYTAEGISTRDVTKQIVKALGDRPEKAKKIVPQPKKK